MTRKLWAVGLALALLLTMPAQAYAKEKVPVSCSLTLSVMDPGTISLKKDKAETTGEKTAGALDCDVNALDGAFSTIHDSKIRLNPDGSFSGKLEGKFTLATANGTFKGEMKADVSAVVVGLAPSPPFPLGTPIHQVTDTGKWKLEGKDIETKGTFTVTLVGIVGLPVSLGGLTGGGSMQGVVKTD